MDNRRLRVAGGMVGLCLLLLSGVARAGDPLRDPAAFENGLKRLRATLASGKCEACRKRLDRLLEQHQGAAYVCAKRVELEDLVRRVGFGIKHPPKDPQLVVSGMLKKYKPQTGAIQIEYTAKTMKDWDRDGGFYSHPAHFRGPFSIEVRGKHYARKVDHTARIVVGYDDDARSGKQHVWSISAGLPPHDVAEGQSYLPAVIRHFVGKEDEDGELLEEQTSPARAGRPFKFLVSVKSTSLSASVNGKSIGKVRKPKGVFGFATFEARGFETVKLAGKIDAAWIQGRLDKLSEQDRQAFRRSFKPKEHLPAWIYAQGNHAPTGKRRALPNYPNALTRTQYPDYLQGYTVLQREDGKALRVWAAGLREKGFPEVATAFLTGLAEAALYRLPEARTAFEAALAADPDFGRAQLMHGLVLRMQGERKQAKRQLDSVFREFDPDEGLYERISIELLLAGRLAAVRTVMQTATEHGLESESMTLLGTALVKAENGPDWSKSFEYKTANYHVVTDIGKETARDAGQMLEQMHRLYQSSLASVRRDKTRLFKVYMFSGESGFLGYMGDLAMLWGVGGMRAAGVYSPMLKQLLIWNLRSRKEMMATVRHEGFHQYLDRFLPTAPTWFNEGLAVYYEYSKLKSGKTLPGQTDRSSLALLDKRGILSVSGLLALTPKDFYGKGLYAYANAWALVHLLRHGKTWHRRLFTSFVAALGRMPVAEAVAEVFPADVIERLDTDLEAHVSELAAK